MFQLPAVTATPARAYTLFALATALLVSDAAAVNVSGAQPGGGMAAVAGAAKAGKHLLILFYKDDPGQKPSIFGSLLGNGGQKTEAMKKVFDSAASQLSGEAEAVSVKITDPAEKEIVTKLNTGKSAMPLTMVIAPNGAVTGAFPEKVEAAQIRNSIVSPGLQKSVKALQDKKLVLLCIQNPRTTNNETAMKGVKEFKADTRFGAATEIVMIDPGDKAEAKMLTQFKVDSSSGEASTVLLAPPGNVAGVFKGATSKDAIMEKLKTAAAPCAKASGAGAAGCAGCPYRSKCGTGAR